MFAGLVLAVNGYRPLILERGADVDSREKAVNRFWREGVLDAETNVQFGEGGAGTFSDGKLTTRINDRRCERVLEEYHRFGAHESILYKARPHIGTDVTNGMSEFARDRENANSALVVSVGPADFGSSHPLAGIEFQIPPYVTVLMKEAIGYFDRKIRGFAMKDALLTGVEIRTSSPVRLLRTDSLEALGMEGLYPAGEGAGYAGGIVSAAVDGIRVAERIILVYAPPGD